MTKQEHIQPRFQGFRHAALASALAVIAFTAGCKGTEEAPGTTAPVATVRAEVATVGGSSMSSLTSTPGTVVSEQQVQVASRLMGYIREFNVHEGQAVKAGQLLFTIDPTDIQGQVSQAQAGLAQAQAALADAQADYERFTALYKDESIPKQQYDKIRLQYHIARSQVAAAKAGLATAQAQLRYAQVRAPVDGVVVQKMADAGDLAAPGRPVLALENLGRLQVQTNVGDDVFAGLKVGDPVQVSVDGQAVPIAGKVARIVPAADPLSHTYLVKIDVPQTAGLKSGTFARVGFPLGQKEGIQVPRSAVLDRAGITGVFVVDSQGIAHYRMVRTGAEAGGQVEIQAGLNKGEKIVVSNTDDLQSGDKIESAGGGNG